MAVFKCKMCGGALEVAEQATTVTCDYCGSQQTLPKLDGDKLSRLYDRAGHFRRNNEFDKAAAIYEEILNENNTDAEAYWSLVLCSYGIEYVEDPSSGRRIPTVNRAQFTSIFDDDNYKSALRYADFSQKNLYEAEARAINEIQKGILAISQKEEPFDIFICYKESDEHGRRTRDSVTAQDLYYQLTDEGYKVFFARITLEGKLGEAYEPYIFAALNSAKVMIVLGTKPEYFNAVWVKNEWSRYLSLVKQSGGKKLLIPAYKDMDPYNLPEEFSHLQAQDMSKLGFMQDLIRGIKKIISPQNAKVQDVPVTPVAPVKSYEAPTRTSGGGDVDTILRRVAIFLDGKDWENANIYCEKALDIDPENSRAYIYKLMTRVQVSEESDLVFCMHPLDTMQEYKNAIRFSDEETAARLIGYNNVIVASLAEMERERLEQERRDRELAAEKARLKAELDQLNNAKNQAEARLSSLLKEKERLENRIRQARERADAIKHPRGLRVLCKFEIILFIISFIVLITASTLGTGSAFGVYGLTVVVYILFAIIILKMARMRFGLIFINIPTWGIYAFVVALIVSKRCKKQISAQYHVEVENLTAELLNVNTRLEEARNALLEVNTTLSAR